MNIFFATVTEAQKESLAAAGAFTNNLLLVIERLTQLNIEVSRSACEKSSELTLFWLDACLAEENTFAWNQLMGGRQAFFGVSPGRQ